MKFLTNKVLKLCSIILLLFMSASVYSQTKVSGGIFSNTTWRKSKSPYIVTSNIVVFDNVTLTIEPGVVVKFDTITTIEFRNSQLIAKGTPTDSITFTANSIHPVPGSWSGITIFNSFSKKFVGASLSFEYFKGLYANNLITMDNSPSIVELSYIRNSFIAYNMVGLSGGNAVNIINCKFYKNETGIGSGHLIENTTFINNYYGVRSSDSVNTCTFSGNKIGYEGTSSVMNSIFTNNDLAVKYGTYGKTFAFNIIKNNTVGIEFSQSVLNNNLFNNIICNNKQFNVKRAQWTGNSTIDLRNNCWCTTDSVAIEKTIYDFKDDFILGLILISPDSCETSKNICSIAGTVHEGNISLSDGNVTATDMKTLKTYSVIVKDDGTFKLDSLAKGNYLLTAVGNGSNYLPTYYPNKIYKNEAVILNLQGTIINIDIFLQPITGINDETTVKIQVSPNPFTNNLQITSLQEIEVKNISGMVVFKGKVEGNNLDTSIWNQGVYFISGGGKTFKIFKE